MGSFLLRLTFALTILLGLSDALHAKNKSHRKVASKNKSSVAKMKRAPTSGGNSGGPQQPLQVKGQARQLSMMLVLKNEKDSINFVHLRTNYQTEIVNTEF